MAMLCEDEYPDLDINKVVKMCLIHDLGEAITGDVPAFLKTEENEKNEEKAIQKLLFLLPDETKETFSSLFAEMSALNTNEAKLFKALDNIEALISHNEADISTWLPNEYELNLIYGDKNSEWSEWTRQLRKEVKEDSVKKINELVDKK